MTTNHLDVHRTKHLTYKQVQEEIDAIDFQLMRKDIRRNFTNDEMLTLFFTEDVPGVYIVFLKDEPIHIGETGNLRGRMRNLRDARTHTIRHELSKMILKDESGYDPRNKKIPHALSVKVDTFMFLHVTVAGCMVRFGRKEIEEALIAKYNPKQILKKHKSPR